VHKTSIEFDYALWLKLEAYCKVVGATQSRVVRLALEEYLNDQIKRNKDTGKKHEQKIRELLATAGNITAIGARRKPRRKALAVDGKSDSDAQIQK
jgi:hypothetical protein